MPTAVEPTGASPLPSDGKVDWVHTATGLHRPALLQTVTLFSGNSWNGIRVQKGIEGGGDRPEGYFTWHRVNVNAANPCTTDMWWPGRRFTAHRVTLGKVLVLPTHMPNAVRWTACETISIDIAPEFVESVAGRGLDRRHLEIHPAFAVEDGLVAQLASILVAEVRAGGPNGRLYGEGLGTALVAHLLRFHGAVPQRVLAGVRALSSGDLHCVLQYIDDHLETTLSLQELADVLRMKLYRAFKQSTGLPPHRYILQRRIERAKVLLARGTPIGEIALRLGFADQSHFSTTFRRLTSTTPWRYRHDVR